jgi:3-oxoacyl-[acyl-carrier protein] reductase
MPFAERVALVTGASQGIGRACALELARAGAKVALAARNQDKLKIVAAEIAAAGGQAEAFQLDVSSEESIKAAAKEAIAQFGKVDILVNNAGFGDMAPIEEVTDEHFEKVMAINLFGVFRYCREAARTSCPETAA